MAPTVTPCFSIKKSAKAVKAPFGQSGAMLPLSLNSTIRD